tara:strand:- start:645 stop:2180 length:1536 start_codon:yes stop_codon:yes gene_type:complete
MAYNYTVSEFTFTEATTDAVYAGNMISGGTMTITPNSGYVVSASNFSASSTLPGQFASIAFSDTAVAGEINNTVLVTFTFSTLFEMSPTLNNINLPITGHADLIDDKRSIDFSIDFVDNTTNNTNGSVTSLTPNGTIVENPSFESSLDVSTGLQQTNLSGTIDANNTIVLATIRLAADSNFHFNDNATITIENAPSSSNFLLTPSTVQSSNSEGQITSRDYMLKLFSDVSIPSGLGCKIFINYDGVADLSSTKEIKQIIYGEPEISIKGATKRIQIVGDVGAEFDLTITKNSDNTSIIDANLANADIIHIPAGLIRGINKTLTSNNTEQLFATYQFLQEFPAASANEIYHINVTPKNGTILNSNLTQTAPQAIIYQYINPTITLVGTFSGTSGRVTDIVYTGRPNKTPGQLDNIKTVVESFQINYQLTHGSAINKGSNITWSSTGTSSWSNSAYDSASTTPANHGNHIEIVNIVHTADGSTTASLTADVIVKRFGTKSVTMTINLDTFFTI